MRLTSSAFVGFVLACVPIYADVVFTNLTSPTASGGFVVCGSSVSGCSGESSTLGAAFTPSSNYLMTEVQVQTFAITGATDSNFDTFLYTNSGGLPGAEIAALGSGTAPAYGGGPNMITPGTPITLTSGTEYWLVLAPVDSSSGLAWEDGGISNVPFASSRNGGASFSSSGPDNTQFEIGGTSLTATPEPVASWFLAAAYCAGTIIFRKLRVQ
jgi:hypothetical protein